MGTKTKKEFRYARSEYGSSIEGSSRVNSWTYTITRTRTGSSLKDYRSRIRAGLSATTSFSGSQSTIVNIPGQAFGVLPKGMAIPKEPFLTDLFEYIGGSKLVCSPFPLTLNSLDTTKAYNQAVIRLHKSIRQKRTRFDGGTFAGEMKQTINDLRSVVKAIADKIPMHLASQQRMIGKYIGSFAIGSNGSAVRVRGNPFPSKKVERNLRQKLADAWLTFSLGLSPLVSDVHDLAEAIAHYKFKPRERLNIRGFGEDEREVSHSVLTNYPFGIGHLAYNSSEVTKTSARIIFKGGMSSNARSERDSMKDLDYMAENFGLTAEQFVPTVYNLIPYSWLADYFSNLGDVLMAATTDTSNVRWLLMDNVQVVFKDGSTQAFHSNPKGGGGGSAGGYHAETKSVIRSDVLATMGVPQPSFQLGIPDYVSQVTNLVALLASGNSHPRGY